MNAEVGRLFQAAIELPISARARFVERQTTDPEIRREVLSLLMHDGLAEHLFERVIGEEASSLVSFADLQPGRLIGPYRVVSLLEQGGMGSVYLAERADGHFEQRVAIKVVRSPHPGGFLIQRFSLERRILAGPNHPNIAGLRDGGQTSDGLPYLVMEYVAGLRDGGQTSDGLPYLVMEYVAGQAIDRFCDAAQL